MQERMEKDYLFTSESVTEGHPDKVCDQVADAVLDSILEKDPSARVACEVAVATGLVLVMGEISTECYVDIPKVVRETIRRIGYTRAKFGFDADTCSVLNSIGEQSPDIAQGVDRSWESREGESRGEADSVPPGRENGSLAAASTRADGSAGFEDVGAGDQGMMFGYATDETPELMPMPISLAHRLTRRLSVARRERILPYLRPDGKGQVTVEYRSGRPIRVDTVVVSTQHDPDVSMEQIRRDVLKEVVHEAIPAELLDDRTRYFINPTGRFVIGGPQGDTGLTGRKIIVDTYGGMSRHGGGALSGKDPTKVDRSGAYAARYVAKNLVAAGLAARCEVQVAYAIGVAEPVSLMVDTFGTGRIPDSALAALVRRHFDLRPGAVIERLGLRRPIYSPTAAYGHFGRTDVSLPWEQTDVAEALRRDAEAEFGRSAQWEAAAGEHRA